MDSAVESLLLYRERRRQFLRELAHLESNSRDGDNRLDSCKLYYMVYSLKKNNSAAYE